MALFTSRDRAIAEPGDAARGRVARRRRLRRAAGAPRAGLGPAVAPLPHRPGRRRRPGGRPHPATCTSSTCCRPCPQHTIDLDVGVPARGLHGEAYRGHVFWDELFVFPFLNLRCPSSPGRCCATATGGCRRPARRPGRPGTRGAMYPVAERQRRPRGDPAAAPQPALGPLAARPLPPAAPRRPRRRLQRLAVLPGHRRPGVPATPTAPRCCWRSPASGPSIATYDHGRGPLRDPRGHGPRRVPRRLPRPRRARASTTTPTPT